MHRIMGGSTCLSSATTSCSGCTASLECCKIKDGGGTGSKKAGTLQTSFPTQRCWWGRFSVHVLRKHIHQRRAGDEDGALDVYRTAQREGINPTQQLVELLIAAVGSAKAWEIYKTDYIMRWHPSRDVICSIIQSWCAYLKTSSSWCPRQHEGQEAGHG
eukprot:Sspe_Gene.25133::Locus_10054_Transcript_4_5_Confidence_0.636_Length_588::g.25133::m.25133